MRVNFSSAVKIKKIKGYGASSCWWSPRIKDKNTARDVADILYGDSGLKLNIYRYNVGGGFETDNLRMDNPWRAVNSFMKKDGSYDWQADKYGVRFMKAALDTGNIDTLIFFVNSPHFTHTVTGQTSGGFTEHFSNLSKDKYEAFAKYLVDIAEHFVECGYPVKYISPINEPQWKWGGDYVWQEGCHYEPGEVLECFRVFAKELEKRNSSLRLYGPESGNIKDFTKEYYALLSSDEIVMKYLDVFAYHSYGSDDNAAEKEAFGKWAQNNIKTPRFDMSEWCELPCKHDTKSIESALITARIIGEDLIYTGVDSWTAWVAANQWDNAVKGGKCYSDGLITAKDDWSDYYISMRYYALAHFSKFIPKGSISLDTGYRASRGFDIFSFELKNGNIASVAVNNSNAARIVEPDISFEFAEIIETSREYKLKKTVIKDKKKITISPKTLATVIFYGVS